MSKVLIKELANHKKSLMKAGDEEKLKRGSVVFPIQYYLSNTVNPRYDLPVHWHNEFELIHIISGEYNIFLNHQVYTLCKDDMCIIPCKILHGDSEKKSIALYESVVFDIDLIRLRSYLPDEFLNSIVNNNLTLHNVILHTNEKILGIVQDLFNTFKTEEEGFDLKIPALLLLFFAEIKKQNLYEAQKILSPKKQKQSEQFAAVLNYIKENYSKNISLETLSDIACLSPKYFCRLFHEVTNRSPIEYLNWFRVNMACDKLRNSTEKLSDIALECGFNDFSYFVKTFHRYKNITPLKYRNMED